jgi:hypothetical protein
MNDSKNTHFEYTFYFLFSTYFWRDNHRWEEPPLDAEPDRQTVLKHGIRFEEDKRLFRRDVERGEPLENWENQLRQNWQNICQIYTTIFQNEKQAQQYCQNALLGVTMLILEDGDNLDHHKVTVKVAENGSPLNFVQSHESDALFRISIIDFDKTAACHRFQAETSTGLFLKNLQLHLDDERSPYLTQLKDSETAPNAVFLVCGLTYGGGDNTWNTAVDSVLFGQGLSKHTSLLSTVFTRLIMGQWQFMRIDEAAKNIRALLQDRNADYAHQSNEVRPYCARTRLLERQLQDMYSLNIQARFVVSRIHGALQTLDINANNLAKRLEQIRHEAKSVNAQVQYYQDSTQKISWSFSSDEDTPVLVPFNRSVKNLQNHQVYIQQQVRYLEALRDKWHLYLDKRKTQLGEYLNTLGTVLVFLLAGTTGAVTLNVNKGILGLNFEDSRIYLTLIALLLLPIIWHLMRGTVKLLCCIFHGTWVNRIFCQPVIQWAQSIEFFSWFKKRP